MTIVGEIVAKARSNTHILRNMMPDVKKSGCHGNTQRTTEVAKKSGCYICSMVAWLCEVT